MYQYRVKMASYRGVAIRGIVDLSFSNLCGKITILDITVLGLSHLLQEEPGKAGGLFFVIESKENGLPVEDFKMEFKRAKIVGRGAGVQPGGVAVFSVTFECSKAVMRRAPASEKPKRTTTR